MLIEICHIADTIASYSWSIVFISSLLACFIIRPKFDKLFRDRPIPFDPELPILSALVRSAVYAVCICSNINAFIPTKKNYFYITYSGYDFRGNANIVQIILSFIIYISFFIGFITGATNILISYFFIK